MLNLIFSSTSIRRCRRACFTVLTLLLSGGCHYLPHAEQVSLSPPQLEKVTSSAKAATPAIFSAFKQHQLVAVGDHHWTPAFIEYLVSLTQAPEFGVTIKRVVVEFGNARHQAALDTYLQGGTLSTAQRQAILRDSLYFSVWTPTGYQAFFDAVRQHNLNAPADQQVEIKLAEAAFDWQHPDAHQRWHRAAKHKTDGYLNTVLEALKDEQPTLLIFGSLHLFKAPVPLLSQQAEQQLTLAARIEKRYPGALYVVTPLGSARWAEALSAIQPPALLPTQGTPLEQVPLIDLMPKARFRLAAQGDAQLTLAEVSDALLYVGPPKRQQQFPPGTLNDAAWMAEMLRRTEQIGGHLQRQFQQTLANSLAATEGES